MYSVDISVPIVTVSVVRKRAPHDVYCVYGCFSLLVSSVSVVFQERDDLKELTRHPWDEPASQAPAASRTNQPPMFTQKTIR